MNQSVCCLSLLILSVASASGVDRGRCDRPFEATFRHGAELQLDLRAGDIEIAGTDEAVIEVTCRVGRDDDASEISVTFEDNGRSARLKVSDGPNNDVRIRVLIPKKTHLRVRCTAGELELAGVRGDLDISLRAGDLRIDVGDPDDYALAEASVKAGDLHATAFGVHKGGLFRSFSHKNPEGKYRLRASLWAGDLTLKGTR